MSSRPKWRDPPKIIARNDTIQTSSKNLPALAGRVFNERGAERGFDFKDKANKSLKQALFKTYCRCNRDEILQAFYKLLDIYENKIKEIGSGKITLKPNELRILEKVKNY